MQTQNLNHPSLFTDAEPAIADLSAVTDLSAIHENSPATTTVDQRLNYVAASHAQASQAQMHSYINRLCQLLPYNSFSQQPWEIFQVSRVLIKNIERSFDLDNSRDIQDFFVLLLRQRAQDAEIKMRIEMLASEMLAEEQFQQESADANTETK